MRLSALSLKAVRWLADKTASRLRDDPGVGDEQQRRAVARVVGADLTASGFHDLELHRWIEDVEANYLRRWKAACASGGVSREQIARMLTSFLLGEGCSREALRTWVRDLERDARTITIVELIELAEARIAAGSIRFEAALLFSKPPGRHLARPTQRRNPGQMSAWLKASGLPATRQYGGLLLEIDARDGYAAAQAAAEIASRLAARGVGTRQAFEIAPEVLVRGISKAIPVNPSRRADVRALEREGRLLDVDAAGPIDAALELLSHVNRSPDAVAAAAGWSAVESLLSGPGDIDKVVTADRLATLVACSWPRAELTTIAWARVYQAGKSPDALAEGLKNYATNRNELNACCAQSTTTRISSSSGVQNARGETNQEPRRSSPQRTQSRATPRHRNAPPVLPPAQPRGTWRSDFRSDAVSGVARWGPAHRSGPRPHHSRRTRVRCSAARHCRASSIRDRPSRHLERSRTHAPARIAEACSGIRNPPCGSPPPDRRQSDHPPARPERQE